MLDRRQLFGAVGAGLACSAVPAAAQHADKKHEGTGPLAAPHLHFCGIHMVKKNPKLQFVAHHFCTAHTGHKDGDLFQCVLYDGTGADARLIGVEYVISDAAYRKLPEEEKKYWHAHTYEVLGGWLVAPGMPEKEEGEFMNALLTTWGKAWHTWPDLTADLPTGEPLLMWSLMGDGQTDEKVLAARDKELKVDSAKISAARVKAIGYQPPNVALPKDGNAVGRQWTDSGDDKPTKAK